MRISILVFAPLFCAAGGQTFGAKLEFDAASVKPSVFRPGVDGLCHGGPATGDPAMFTCQYVDLKRIIVWAFGLQPFQIASPDWTQIQRFDIQAAIPAGTTKKQFEAMLQNLLIDRFHLTFHREPRDVNRYELRVAAAGPKLKEAQETSAPPAAEPAPSASSRTDPAAGRKLQLDKDGYPIRTRGFANIDGRARFYEPQGQVDSLLPLLNMVMDQPVIDSTGLKGTYEIEINWGQSGLFGRAKAAQATGAVPAADVGSPGPTIQQALRDQLGLRLEMKKGPMETLVIDHIDKVPTEN